MYNKFLLPFSSAALLAAALCVAALSTVLAAPADEISSAVSAGGATVREATPAQFVRALSSMLTRIKEQKFPEYASSAIKLRPDLAPQITAATLRARRPGIQVDDSCNWVNRIIRAAVAAAPDAKAAIVRAALQQEPAARECIFAAAGMQDGDGTQTAFFRPPGVDAGNINSSAIGTISPGNISAQRSVRSDNQERVTICHNGNTLRLPRPAAEAHLRNHSGDRSGPCPQ